jgi:MraZ protein
MLIGRYYHSLEQKSRLSIPKSFREYLGQSAFLTSGLDGCLFLYNSIEWTKLIQSATKLPITKKAYRDWVRLLANNAIEVNFDSLGRILIPDYLVTKANLTKAVTIVGSVNHAEIWDRDNYHAYFETIENQAEKLAESIHEPYPGLAS